ncbi:MAG: hypothetical protein Q8M66_04140, partial [Actinomycetota bacterium]|nr:hypothetical protein [Actinomycetota bacterium]
GLKKSALPKIEVHRAAHGSTLLCRGEQHDPTLLAVASDEPLVPTEGQRHHATCIFLFNPLNFLSHFPHGGLA